MTCCNRAQAWIQRRLPKATPIIPNDDLVSPYFFNHNSTPPPPPPPPLLLLLLPLLLLPPPLPSTSLPASQCS